MRRRALLLPLVPFVLVAAFAAPAGAATVSLAGQVIHDPGDGVKLPEVRLRWDELSVVAAPGEANRLTVADAAGGALLVRDDGAPLQAGEHCAPVAGGVRCAVARSERHRLRIRLGDGDDRLDL